MDAEVVFKALANPVRLSIMEWLKKPDFHFPPMSHLPEEEKGLGYVCVGAIQAKGQITQSTASSFLSMMKKSGLLTSKRIGQWTYYRRNETFIQEVARYIGSDL